jgi:hypothetical protein
VVTRNEVAVANYAGFPVYRGVNGIYLDCEVFCECENGNYVENK